MASRRSHRIRSNKAEPESDDQAILEDEKTIRRRASVYDAVAGRVTGRLIKTNTHRSNPSSPSSSTDPRDPTRQPPLAPEEVLFRRKDAPARYAEKDIYFAGTDALPSSSSRDQTLLPPSDLLKAVHLYAAGFYEAVAAGRERRGKAGRVGGRLVDERSMDETALLAFGVLLEEASREALGKNGDLVFTEGVDEDPVTVRDDSEERGRGKGTVGGGSGAEVGDSGDGRSRKRRKLSRGSTAG